MERKEDIVNYVKEQQLVKSGSKLKNCGKTLNTKLLMIHCQDLTLIDL